MQKKINWSFTVDCLATVELFDGEYQIVAVEAIGTDLQPRKLMLRYVDVASELKSMFSDGTLPDSDDSETL